MSVWKVVAHTELGPRHRNEDTHLLDEARGIWVVCDGMGKHAGGDVASQLAARTVAQALANEDAAFAPLARLDSAGVRTAAQAAMARAISAACRAVYEAGKSDPSLRDMGTTLDAVVTRGRFAIIGHVGDGRTYLSRARQLYQLTEDHSLVAAQLKAGTITKEEAERSPFKNVLVRSLGQQPDVEVDTAVLECVPGDVLLTCTDGLHGPVSDQTLAATLAAGFDPTLPRRLLAHALERGTKDNSTCLVLSLPEAAATEEDTLAVGKLDALRRVPLFEQFDYREKQAVLAIANMDSRRTGEPIVREGESSSELYVVVRGKVQVEAKGSKLAELGAGAHFGEMGLVDDAPRSATVVALEPSVLLRLTRDDLWGLMRREPELGMKLAWSFVQSLSNRLRSSNDNLVMARTSTGFRVPDHLRG